MKANPRGLIGTFLAVAAVNTPTRRELSEKTKETYVFWLKRFHRYVQRPAGEWTGEMAAIYAHADHARGTSPLDAPGLQLSAGW